MKILFRFLLLTFLAINLASCAKDSKEEQKKLIQLTTPKGWLRVKIETTTGNGQWTDVTGNLTPLEVDNLLFFGPNYVWWEDEGGIKFPGDPQLIDHGKYSLIQDRTQLLKDNGELYEILELSKSSLILKTTKNNVVQKTTYKVFED
ncbi:MAG: hypothetical protein EOO99_07725 [Pedobacter sp.]|nr:MAG: hypothetical protein EOO99_07725 [Pedobacter sp.]